MTNVKKSLNKINKLKQDEIHIFTDGSCSKGNIIRCGYGVHFPNTMINDISSNLKYKPLTNQTAELYAIYKGIKKISQNYRFKKLIIYTDSKYSIGCLTEWIKNWKKNNWMTSNNKPVKNVDIIQRIDKYLSNRKYMGKIFFEHVKAHTNKQDYKSRGNQIADELANKGGLKLN